MVSEENRMYITDRYTYIRRGNICFCRLRPEGFEQVDLFIDQEARTREKNMQIGGHRA